MTASDRKSSALALVERLRDEITRNEWQGARVTGLKLRLLLEPATHKPGATPPKPWSDTDKEEGD